MVVGLGCPLHTQHCVLICDVYRRVHFGRQAAAAAAVNPVFSRTPVFLF